MDTSRNPSTTSVLWKLMESSRTLPKLFEGKCNEVISSHEKIANDLNRNTLGYTSISAKQGKDVNADVKYASQVEVEELLNSSILKMAMITGIKESGG